MNVVKLIKARIVDQFNAEYEPTGLVGRVSQFAATFQESRAESRLQLSATLHQSSGVPAIEPQAVLRFPHLTSSGN